MKRRFLAHAAIAALASLAVAAPAQAQSYPTKPVKIVAPVQPGGGVDLVARTVAEQLSRSMNASFGPRARTRVPLSASSRGRWRVMPGGKRPPHISRRASVVRIAAPPIPDLVLATITKDVRPGTRTLRTTTLSEHDAS